MDASASGFHMADVRRKRGEIERALQLLDLHSRTLIDIEAEAVLRLIRNPEGYASESDGSYSYQFNRETASGRLEILASEWETLGIKPSRMFSIAPNLGGAS